MDNTMMVKRFMSEILQSFDCLESGVYRTKRAFQKNARIQELSFYCKRLSTPQIGFVLNTATSILEEDECYLNIGVWEGYSFLAASIDNQPKNVVGVDNFSEMNNGKGAEVNNYTRKYGPTRANFYLAYDAFKSHGMQFFEKDWVEFLQNFDHFLEGKKIGAVFYDANHTREAHRKFFDLVLPHLSDQCVIFVDDLRYDFVLQTSSDFLARNPDFTTLFQVEVDKPRHPAWWAGFQALARF